jgi:hypothetical protein
MPPAITRIVVERTARVPFSVAHEYAEGFFRDAERYVDVRVPLRDLFWALRGKLHKPVRLTFALHPDEADDGRLHDAVLVEWHAGTSLFPQFHGTLRMRIATIDTTRLILEGAYRPPLGRVGVIFDRLAGRRIARATMDDLLGRLVLRMEHREAEFRATLQHDSGITA